MVEIREEVIQGKKPEFNVCGDGTLKFGNRLCVLNNEDLKKELLIEAHWTPYLVHPGATKMYKDDTRVYWWNKMKKDIAHFMEQCLTCQ